MFFCWFVLRYLDISSRQFVVFVFESICICGGRQAGETGAYALSGQRSSTHFELDPKSPTALHLIGIGWGEGSWWSDLVILTMWNMDELDNYVRDTKFMIKMIILITLITKLPTDMIKFTGHFCLPCLFNNVIHTWNKISTLDEVLADIMIISKIKYKKI